MRKILSMAAGIAVALMMFAGITPAHAAVAPHVSTIENAAGKSYVVVDATNSDANLQTPVANSKITITASGGTWAWSKTFTYYPQQVNTYEVTNVLGNMTWRIVDTRNSSVYITSGSIDTRFPENRNVSVYMAAGYYSVNGREWLTTCENYSSSIVRCQTLIMSGGAWVFNNLTYLPSPRSAWTSNPIGGYGIDGYKGTWTSSGRQWRGECDTPVTGKGCRSYIWNGTQWVVNNIVIFS